MGFFSNLMGQKLLGTVIIKFYSKNEASLEYETEILNKEQKEMDLIQLFTLYYAKMLFNLNGLSGYVNTEWVISGIQKTIENKKDEEWLSRVNNLVLGSFSSGQKLVERRTEGIIKKYSGELYEKSNNTRIIQTHMNAGEENYYTTESIFMFLQYLNNNLSEKNLIFLTLVVGGMNEYYKKFGTYDNMRSIIEVPNYGFMVATEKLSNSK